MKEESKIIVPDWQLRVWVADDRMIKLDSIFECIREQKLKKLLG